MDAIFARIAGCLPIARWFGYLWDYETNFKKLDEAVKKLEAKREAVEIKIGGEKPLPDVKIWQDGVNKIIDEAWKLINENIMEQAKTLGCMGFFSLNLCKLYQRGENAVGMLEKVVELQREGEGIKEYAHPTIKMQPWLQSSEDYDAFVSRTSILNEIMDALRNPDVNKVGIYGMGGIGKTTLAQEVGREAEQDKLFNKIVFVEVSQSPDIKNIQGVIADYLKLKLTAETLAGRASELYEELKKMKKKEKILLILDNIWPTVNFKVDFKDVGIPLEEDSKELKLLLTTRSCDLLTKLMVESQHQFCINVLNGDDAWSLLKSKAGESIEKPHLKSIATKVVELCGGIPLAIVVIAEALKHGGPEDWENALRELKQPLAVSFDGDLESFDGDLEMVYKNIKLSYNSQDGKLRQIFLLCSRMGRTHDASIQDLFIYGFGLGYFEKINTMEEALRKVHALVNKLKAASLLLGAPNSQEFSVHDVVCHTARIMANGENVFTVIDDVIPQFLTNENTLSKCTSLTLHNYGELPEDLPFVCPNLKFLYMKAKESFSRILDNFFAHMSSLQVLHLIEMDFRKVPTSFSFLVNLQALCLDQCKLEDTTVIGNLKKLEILCFRGSNIEKLPEEMRHLTRLRLLDLTGCSELSVIPPNVMSNLTKLEALYMGATSIQWEVERPGIERSNVSIDELKHLRYLTMLEIHIPDAKMSKGLLSQKLKKYKIFIGDEWEEWHWSSARSKTSRMLKLNLNTNEDENILQYMKGIEELELGEVPGATNLLDALDRNGFPTLKHLTVEFSSHCSCIVESCDALHSLQSLILEYLNNTEKICNSPLGANTFPQLRTIRVKNCPKLNNIFSISTVTVLLQLEEIEVSDCENLEEIFAIGGQDDSNNTEVDNEIKFRQLRSMFLWNLRRLKSFCCKVKPASALQLTRDTQPREIISGDEIDVLTSLFNDKVAFPSLQILHISTIPVETIWHNLPQKISSCVQNLTTLRLSHCGNLKELFSSSTVVTEQSREEEMRDTILFPKLINLSIENLEELTTLWSGYYIKFPTLQEFIILSCPQLNAFIFDDKIAFPNLQTLYIFGIPVEKIWHNLPQKISSYVQNLTVLSVSSCGNLKELFSSSTVVTEQSREEEMRDTILFPKLKGLHMSGLEKLTTLWSGYYIELPTLNEFSIHSCPQLHAFIFDDKVRVPSLEIMEILDMDNLKMIWHNQLDGDSFSKLKSLEVRKCRSLKYLFAASNIVANDEYSPKFLFPKLTSLRLWILPELRSFYPDRHTVEGPVLKRLKLYNCFIHDTDEEDQMQMQYLFCLIEQAFPCLEELIFYGKNIMMILENHVLNVQNDVSTSLPLSIIRRFQNLEGLSLSFSSYKEIFSNGEDQTQTAIFSRIKTLRLSKLKDLKYMWKQDFKQLDLIFQNLEVLNIWDCNSLINVMPPSASFQNLTVMEVESCSSLINIGTSSAAKSLVQLIQLKIRCCDNITEVVGNHGDVTEDEIIFPKLKSLSLLHLPNLTSFCSWNVTLEFPSLEELFVDKCPQMTIFSRGALTTQMLRKVQIDYESIELSPDVDINKAIQQLHEKVDDLEDYSDSSSHWKCYRKTMNLTKPHNS